MHTHIHIYMCVYVGGLTKDEERDVKRSLAAVKSGDNAQKIQNCLVVGVTCMASLFPSLDGVKFPFVILDGE